ncbi:MAG: hypothetical protein AMJ42_05370 [Deltaproteobacteria bacterium DG_8]|nr:MAG: hypothetical protein AMJ42_05370 [Deltaproteobacteria bacterium DG_8]
MKLVHKTLETFIIALFINLTISDYAYAWGAGIHIMEGSYVLDHTNLILPWIAELLKAFPYDYLYGCISADIFIGKGSRRRDDHCHNWSIATKMLEVADSPSHFSFAYGYLCHLCADIIAHNFYIPNQLYLTKSTKKFGHVYWEYRSDAYIEKKYWKLANKIISRQNTHNDEFMQRIFKSKIISFQTKKKLYFQSIKLCDLEHWQDMVSLISRNSRWDVSKDYILYLHKLSLTLILDFLNYLDKSICLNFDPVGSDNIRIAKKKRYAIKRAYGKRPTEKFFTIPEEILKLPEKPYGVHL